MNESMEQALRLFKEKKYQEAAVVLDRIISENPDDPAGYTNFGNLLIAIGDPARATAFFKKALRIDPGFASAAYGNGNACYRMGKIREALDQFTVAQKHGMNEADLFYMIGLCTLKLERAGQALAAFQRAVELNGEDSEARFQYGLALARFGSLDSAEEQFLTVIQQNARHADAFYNLGVIAAYRDHHQKARTFFEKALRLNPRHVLAAHGLDHLKTLEQSRKS